MTKVGHFSSINLHYKLKLPPPSRPTVHVRTYQINEPTKGINIYPKWRKAVFVANFVVQLDNFWTAGRYFNKLYFMNVCVKVCLILVFSFCRLNICCLILSLAQTQNLKLISFFVGHRSAEIEHPIRFSIRGTSKFSEARKVTGKTRKEVTSY